MINQQEEIGAITGEYLNAVRIRLGLKPSDLAMVFARHGVIAAGADVQDWEISGVPTKHAVRVRQALNSLFVETDDERKAARVKTQPSNRAISFGQHLKAIREARGFTRSELGSLIGKTETAIVHFENGELKITLFEAIDIANHLKISLLYLTGEHTGEGFLPEEMASQFSRLVLRDKQLAVKLIGLIADQRGI